MLSIVVKDIQDGPNKELAQEFGKMLMKLYRGSIAGLFNVKNAHEIAQFFDSRLMIAETVQELSEAMHRIYNDLKRRAADGLIDPVHDSTHYDVFYFVIEKLILDIFDKATKAFELVSAAANKLEKKDCKYPSGALGDASKQLHDSVDIFLQAARDPTSKLDAPFAALTDATDAFKSAIADELRLKELRLK